MALFLKKDQLITLGIVPSVAEKIIEDVAKIKQSDILLQTCPIVSPPDGYYYQDTPWDILSSRFPKTFNPTFAPDYFSQAEVIVSGLDLNMNNYLTRYLMASVKTKVTDGAVAVAKPITEDKVQGFTMVPVVAKSYLDAILALRESVGDLEVILGKLMGELVCSLNSPMRLNLVVLQVPSRLIELVRHYVGHYGIGTNIKFVSKQCPVVPGMTYRSMVVALYSRTKDHKRVEALIKNLTAEMETANEVGGPFTIRLYK